MNPSTLCSPCGSAAEDTGAAVSALQDRLTGSLVGLANAALDHADRVDADTASLLRDALPATASHAAPNPWALAALIGRVHAEKARIAPDCSTCPSPCGRTADFDMARLGQEAGDVRALKSLLLLAMRSVAPCALHAAQEDPVTDFCLDALRAIGDRWDAADLLPLLIRAGEVGLLCTERP